MKQWLTFLLLAGLALAPFGVGDFGGINGGPDNPTAMGLWLLGAALFFAAFVWLARATGAGDGGLRLHPGWRRNLGIGLIYGLFCMTLAIAGDVAFGKYAVTPHPWPRLLAALLPVAVGTLFIALSEELVFRGYLMRILGDRAPAAIAVVSALLFVALHLKHWGEPPVYWIGLFVKGLFYAIPVLATRSVWFGIGHHWGWNFVHFLLFGGVTGAAVHEAARYPWPADWGHLAVATLMALSAPVFNRILARNDL
ncbi:MAG TPA: CPBP family intramembrane glutamic endopeptidase [Symbiobacteriaceae bacterium]|nr:CPBP family intramembrane glutamic endopeptidase [Symbiobacteriaceae bacterium]